ncbi:MAG TPA: alpha/beta fold hydrolase [Ferrovibrio sp.]|jgi:putative redox protein|uniref:bifunctional alpha/beta hydrolase/OsmC family protein n=1 Tax=Ferrovibrio sp. TaxID=1917215 RepID=UPI002ED311DA
MDSRKVEFAGSSGATLAARLEMPAGDATPIAFALFAHCFTCSKDAPAAVKVSRALAARGVATLRFDFTGLGGSGGDFASTNFSSNVADLIAAADYLRRMHRAPALLIGHSLGGAAVLAAAAQIAECKAVATIGAPFDAAHVEHAFLQHVPQIEADGEARASLGGRQFTIRKQLLDDLRRQKQKERIAGLRRALLVLHAPGDGVVGIDNASQIFLAARHPKSFVSLDRADHFLSRAEDADYVAGVIAAWAARYLASPAAAAADAAAEAAAAEYRAAEDAGAASEPGVLVEETGQGLFQQRIRIGRHAIMADEPQSMGGRDSGPAPYDLLAAALGACKAMTMRLYANRKNLPLRRTRVHVVHDRIHAEDCADCETKDGHIDEFRVTIGLEGELSDEQRARILEIADKCPVHRTLHSEVKIRTEEAAREAPV